MDHKTVKYVFKGEEGETARGMAEAPDWSWSREAARMTIQ